MTPTTHCPGVGEPIEIDRFYNSVIQTPGLFGFGWSTKYDESLIFISNQIARWNRSDGRAVYFARKTVNDPYKAFSRVSDVLIPNQNGTFTIKDREGTERNFGSTGQLLGFKDRYNNVTSLTYNQSGVLIQITDPVNRTLNLTPNANGTIAEISDSLGAIAQYEYEPNSSRLSSVTYPDGSKYSFVYDTVGNKTVLTTVKDALNNIIEFHEYDSSGRAITSERHDEVEKLTFAYQNDVTTVTDALGHQQKYYFTRGYGYEKPIRRIEGPGCCGTGGSTNTDFTFYSDLNIKAKTDALGRTTTYKYDSLGNKVEEMDVLGKQTWTYNSFSQMLTYRDRVDSLNPDPDVTTIANTYDSVGNLLTSKDALGNITTLANSTLGQPLTITDARNNTTTLTWDSQGRMTKITDADGKETSFGYNARARVTSVTNALSETTQFEYDDKDRLNKITHPDTSEINIGYDLAGRRTSVTDENNNETTLAYDNAYRLTSITDALNHARSFDYDLMSNLTEQTDALGNITSFEYDDFDRLKKIVYPVPTASATPLQETMTYDALGNLKTRVDTAGRTTSYDYDTANRLIKITDPLSNLTQFEYNTRSHMTKVKDALNQEYTFTYDPLGRKLSETRAGTTMSFGYDAVGNRTSRTDHNGAGTTYAYDVLNRLTGITYSGSSQYVTYGYDDLSRLTSAINQNGNVAFAYDNRGRRITETDIFGHVIENVFDAAGNRTGLKLDSVSHTGYVYDATNKLTELTVIAESNAFGLKYDVADRLIALSRPNKVKTDLEYDGMSRLTRLRHSDPFSTLFDEQYSYNPANQIGQIAGLTQTRNFAYDNIDRLTGMTDGTVTESYAYDPVGNRTSSHRSATYTTGLFNRLTATASTAYSYNLNGSNTGRSGVLTWTYGWDRENRMTSASSGFTSVTLQYDALGRRVKRTQGSNVQKYSYDGSDVVIDDINGTLTKYQNGPGIDNKLKQTTSGTSRYFVQNHLGSTVALTNPGGGVTDTNSYDSFGNATNTSFPSRYQYTGREYDTTTGLQFSRARWYDPQIGRFISEDPIGFAGGDVNLYGYVRNSPINRNDPLGLDDSDQVFYSTLPDGWDQAQIVQPNRGRWGMIGGVGDFIGNYNDMVRANTHGADKFFHCMANCEASRRGYLSSKIGGLISETREMFDQHVKGDSLSACNQDRFANETGAIGGLGILPCSAACSQFRPPTLQYPVPIGTTPQKSYRCWGGARGC